MINAKVELTKFLEGKDPVKCALISFDKGAEPNEDIGEFVLKIGYSEEDWEAFMSFLDFVYNDWSGIQQLFGIIWTETGWCDRNSYHGKEWWQSHTTPDIPALCLQ